MEIYNKGKRDFIIRRGDYLSDNIVEATDALGKRYAHIKPETKCDITDSVAELLLKNYPKEIMFIGKGKKKKKE